MKTRAWLIRTTAVLLGMLLIHTPDLAGEETTTSPVAAAATNSAPAPAEPVELLEIVNMEGYARFTAAVDLMAAPEVRMLVFSATWCGPCRTYKNQLKGLPPFMRSRIAVIDADLHPELANFHGIEAMPTTVFLWNGGNSGPLRGAQTMTWVVEQMESAIREGRTAVAERDRLRASAAAAVARPQPADSAAP